MAEVSGIRVQQWLAEWDEVPMDRDKYQAPPPHEFYVTSIRASQLRALSDVHQRDAPAGKPRSAEVSVQRDLEADRSGEIRRYIRDGFPLSSLGRRRMDEDERRSLRKPGWLPTAIIANVVPAGDEREGSVLHSEDAVHVLAGDGANVTIKFPDSWTGGDWHPQGTHPLEIIDGQHRLSAFDSDDDVDFELPVVLFSGLDFSWQAYLFWTVNIKPKRINASLAFDLYPLLREQDWLDAGESLNVYRETRAQELVEALWGDPESVWYDRVNMLGQTKMRAQRPVTQAAFVRGLTSSFVRSFKGQKGLGGLFGGAASRANAGFDWPRGQQSAFLICAWNSLAAAILETDSDWAQALRAGKSGASLFQPTDPREDPAFIGTGSLLASDQGVRAFHMVLNDLSYLGQDELRLRDWTVDDGFEVSSSNQFDEARSSLQRNQVGEFLRRVGIELARFDWRNSKGAGLSPEVVELRKSLRGSGGYSVLRDWIFAFLVNSEDVQIARLAEQARVIHA
ncbi:DGQHR domain-containing protein [Curtobacterium flaccumfaciens]|uniref:DGQHR domain-containing protein n=1 Tax=Curtobacterium flaccumfaciens TaxID=2035 RepID=UPI00217EF7DA|nr:DGQHR domain-containing protein [Curtobacterium flaccumfaciens]MCS6589530.1 DGQHR domain-containing protein [Curtobacterium flaccumfaciens pv. flaccumfaciens]